MAVQWRQLFVQRIWVNEISRFLHKDQCLQGTELIIEHNIDIMYLRLYGQF